MDDVKLNGDTAPQVGAGGEAGTSQSVTPQVNQTAVSPAQPAQPAAQVPAGGEPPATPPIRTIPYDRFAEVNKKFRDVQRELAAMKSKSTLSQYSTEDMDQLNSHPYVQKLLIDNAKRDVTDFARETLEKEEYKGIPGLIKKAILKNVRGFIGEETTDPETAKLDIVNYIDGIVEELANEQGAQATTQPPVQKTSFPVSPANAGVAPQGGVARPAEVQKILEKPVSEWTDEEMALLDKYSSTGGK